MVDFNQIKMDQKLRDELSDLVVSFAFQPIYHNPAKKSGKRTVYAYEALMRPQNKSISDLISEYTEKGKLHLLEVATFLGAAQEYVKRGYTEDVSINSFPSEYMTETELSVFDGNYPQMNGKVIVEVLEYPGLNHKTWDEKKTYLSDRNFKVAVDDFGKGGNTLEAVKMIAPHIVKLDRSLVSNVDKDSAKKEAVYDFIRRFHSAGMKVLAEGVETEEEFRCLANSDVDYLQGYYLGMPR